VGFFQGHHAFVAYPFRQQHSGVFPEAQELGVRTAVGQARDHERMAHDLAHRRVLGIVQVLDQEQGAQFFAERDFAEGIERALALRARNLADITALVFALCRVKYLHALPVTSPQAILVMIEIVLQAAPDCGIAQIREPLLHRARQRLVPFRHVVEQVVLDEIEQRLDAV